MNSQCLPYRQKLGFSLERQVARHPKQDGQVQERKLPGVLNIQINVRLQCRCLVLGLSRLVNKIRLPSCGQAVT